MANKKRKCKHCKKYHFVDSGLIKPVGFFCSERHMLDWASERLESEKAKNLAKAKREREKAATAKRQTQKRKDKQRLKELKSRSAWYKQLQKLVNQYVNQVRDANKPCCTCGKKRGTCKTNAGHFIPVGAGGGDRRRFNLFNIHTQCETCNNFKGGAPREYEQFIINEYGLEKLEWLQCEANHPTLKQQFPTWQDIETEIVRYRKLIREAGLTPIA